MFNEEKQFAALFQTVSDEFIEDADDFRKTKNVKKSAPIKYRRFGAIAASFCALLLTVACGAAVTKFLHIDTYNSVEDYIKEKHIKSWENVSYESGSFDEDIYLNAEPEALVDILLDSSDEYILENGTDENTWLRKIYSAKSSENLNAYDRLYYEAYDYQTLSLMFRDYGIGLDLEYVEENFGTVIGEYGCDFLYSDNTKSNCLYERFVSGYSDQEGRFVSIEYLNDLLDSNNDPFVLYEDGTTTGYMRTADGVEVLITKAKGTYGGQLITARVMTENTMLAVDFYGEFSNEEVETLLNSLKISKIIEE